MFLFFFFKQKTAYEMRISDWSSDVCSSDLAARQEWQRIETTLNREISHKPFSVSGAAIWDIGGDYSLALSLARSQRAPNVQELYARGIQIGRASCRESVCKYV